MKFGKRCQGKNFEMLKQIGSLEKNWKFENKFGYLGKNWKVAQNWKSRKIEKFGRNLEVLVKIW